MCIVLFAWQVHPEYPLVVAANRDEFFDRPAEPARWRDGVLCGLDLSAGGTWIGVSRTGRFACITNYREPASLEPRGTRSRGELPMEFLQGRSSAREYAMAVQERAHEYGGFNLLLFDRHSLWYLSNRGDEARPVEPGLHGLSNGLLDTPWPKVERGREHLRQALESSGGHPDTLLELLQDRWCPDDHWLPDTGVGIEMERLVAPIFVHSRQYGTRASTVVRIDRSGTPELVEQRWAPDTEPDGNATCFRTRTG